MNHVHGPTEMGCYSLDVTSRMEQRLSQTAVVSRRGPGVGPGAVRESDAVAAPAHLQIPPIARHVFLLDEGERGALAPLAGEHRPTVWLLQTGSRSSRIGLPSAPDLTAMRTEVCRAKRRLREKMRKTSANARLADHALRGPLDKEQIVGTEVRGAEITSILHFPISYQIEKLSKAGFLHASAIEDEEKMTFIQKASDSLVRFEARALAKAEIISSG